MTDVIGSSPEAQEQDAYTRLKNDILRGIFPPGSRLLMSALKERYDTGVGPLREVLSQLVAERLVVAINQKGYRVASMSLAELTDVYDARARLEALIVRLALLRGDEQWEAEVVAKAYTLSRVDELHSQQEMLDVWDARHKAFHSAIAAGCGSQSLLQARTFLADQAERYRQIWLQRTVFSPAALEEKREEHQLLMDMVLTRDIDKAEVYIYQHLMTPVPVIRAILEQGDTLTAGNDD
ncbi:transcriptional regulator [Salmonella enterica subsp. enterica serovar Choleraesuis]|nr:transcriptional regulator [Salmonella enterica subsp. enterica serovar Choleraesuis]